MRLRKSDPSGSYWYLCDGVSPASPVLTDGHTTFTPGLSEYNSLGSRFYLADAQGNSRGLADGGQAVTDGYNWDAFGNSVSRLGSNPTAFAWNEASGYQTDNDGGLTLLGHRYYDRRTGRFISQDPAGDGDNWYAYCGNSPMNNTDPSGLWWSFSPDPNHPAGMNGPNDTGGSLMSWQPDNGGGASSGGGGGDITGPSVGSDAADGFEVGVAATLSALSGHLWDGGAAKNDPSFAVSRGLADVGVMAGTAAFGGAAAAVGKGAEAAETIDASELWGSRRALEAGKYAKNLRLGRTGSTPPKIQIFKEGDRWVVWQGHHRARVAAELGNSIPYEDITGTIPSDVNWAAAPITQLPVVAR